MGRSSRRQRSRRRRERAQAVGGFRLTGISLTVRGVATGLDADGFAKAAEDAKATCPVCKALTGVPITLDAALAG